MSEFDALKEGDAFDCLVDLIDNTGGRRRIDGDWAAALGHLMDVRGQRQAIGVRRTATGFATVWGHHRVEGKILTGRPYIKAVLVTGNERDWREAEISENLFRRNLSPLERAADVADLIDIQKARLGVSSDKSAQSVAATARWADRMKKEASDASDTMSDAFGWTAKVAEALDLTERTIRRDLELHRGLKPDLVAAIQTTGAANNASQLLALAKMSEADQRLVVSLIVEGTAKGVNDAAATLKQAPVKSPVQKAWSAILSNFSRLGNRDRKDVLRQMAQGGQLPKGVTLIIDGVTIVTDGEIAQ